MKRQNRVPPTARVGAILAVVSLLGSCGDNPASRSDPASATTAIATSTVSPATTAIATSTVSPAPTTLSPGTTASAPTDSTDAWSADLDLLDATIRARHPSPFWKTSEATWSARINDLKRTLPNLDHEHAIVELIKLVALLDTHSGVFPDEAGFRFYPFALYEFSVGVFVVGAKDPDLVGSRLTSIGGMPTAKVLDATTPLVNADNNSGVLYSRTWIMICAECLHGIGVTTDVDHPAFTFERPDGTIAEPDVAPISVDELLNTVYASGVSLFVIGQENGPEAVARRAEPVWWRTDIPSSTFLLSYNDTGTDAKEALKAMTAALDDGSATRVVLDMRYAQGGSFNDTAELREALAGEARLRQPGALTVMIGRENVSAGTGLASWLDANTDAAALVGEPTPARPNPPVDETTFTLPNSGVIVHIPTNSIQITDASDTRTAVTPDVPIALSAAEFFAGHDPALEQALAGTSG